MSCNLINLSNGGFFDFNGDPEKEPCVDDHVDIESIALGLSREARFAGQSSTPYSVADHSVWVSRCLGKGGFSPGVRMLGLLHDAAEAFMRDLPSPLKELLPEYKAIEDRVHRRILRRLQPDLLQLYWRPETGERIKRADVAAYLAECAHLFGAPKQLYADMPIEPQPSRDASYASFMRAYVKLDAVLPHSPRRNP
jgi:5'-deoxynucleotidase YfbR-like HD superfamily hydrolase